MIRSERRKRAVTHSVALTVLSAAVGGLVLFGQQAPQAAAAPSAIPLPMACKGTATVAPTDPSIVLLRDTAGKAVYRVTATGNCTGNLLISKVTTVLDVPAEGTCGSATGTGQATVTWFGPLGLLPVGTSTGNGTVRFTNDADGNVTLTTQNLQITQGLFAGPVSATIAVDTPGVGKDCWSQGSLAGGTAAGTVRLTLLG
jgi:hypothetical protein